ncbi:MAG: Eco57I restriction-modification methylase domain-containing protein, partial [Alphaproteobacteria bacterium]|nr:Eco57I restriction-modification methylase domain-containing protein [Alphaproteobacteria bacterium]
FFTTQQNTDIHIPNNVFSTDNGTAGILDIFDKYIFTLCDTMPSNNKNVISPEILGTIFERLLSTQSKKSHGTVYTPPKIVHLICCECLTYFLQTKFSHDIPASEIASFIHNGTTTPRIKKHAKKINDALAQILIFDPAIGSGAFPIGMMHTITQARLKLDNDKKNLHAYKLHFIQHCLHGTDIAPHALQNTKLRLWLSLISDDKVPPLHSLKFNLLCTNPLLDTISNTTKFDIVIGNPPYVGEKSNKEQFQQIKEHSLGKFYQGKMDLFYFFFHLGLNLARPSGIVAFITTNYYITANGAYNLRTDIKNRANILSLINFNELRIFDTAHGQHNMITILQKQDGTSPVPKCKYCYTERTGIATPDIIQDIILERDCKTIYSSIPQQNLYSNSENYIRTTNNAPTITQKIKTNSDMLGNVFNVNQGIISGADKISDKHLREYQLNATKNEGIYVLDETNDNDAIILSQIRANNEDDILRSFFKNSDIKQFSTATHSTKHIIYANKNNYDLTKYPTIDAHLNRFRALLDNATDNSPYLHRPRNDAIFTGPKIIAPQRSSINTFGYNDTPWYSSADVYYITPKT